MQEDAAGGVEETSEVAPVEEAAVEESVTDEVAVEADAAEPIAPVEG